jgi:hypothetical protein
LKTGNRIKDKEACLKDKKAVVSHIEAKKTTTPTTNVGNNPKSLARSPPVEIKKCRERKRKKQNEAKQPSQTNPAHNTQYLSPAAPGPLTDWCCC